MTLFITTFFDWIVSIINAINDYPIYGVLFLLPILSLVIIIVKKSIN